MSQSRIDFPTMTATIDGVVYGLRHEYETLRIERDGRFVGRAYPTGWSEVLSETWEENREAVSAIAAAWKAATGAAPARGA